MYTRVYGRANHRQGVRLMPDRKWWIGVPSAAPQDLASLKCQQCLNCKR